MCCDRTSPESAISYQLSTVGGEDRSVVRKHDIRDESIFFTSITNPFNSSHFVLKQLIANGW